MPTSTKIVSGPTPFLYRYSFKPSGKCTELSLDAEAEKEDLMEVLGTKHELRLICACRFCQARSRKEFPDAKELTRVKSAWMTS